MSLAPVTQDASAVYTSRALVEAMLPPGAITTQTQAGSGKIRVTDLTEMIADESRRLDADLGCVGIAVPFPDIAGSNPSTPRKVVEIATNQVIGECRAVLAHGNRTNKPVKHYLDLAESQRQALIDKPKSIGYGIVSTPDDFLSKVMGQSSAQYGRMQAVFYRLRNRNVIASTLRWVTSAGVEVVGPGGMPFLRGSDWDVYGAADGVLVIPNFSAITAAVGVGGGAVYQVSWRNLAYGTVGMGRLPGINSP